MLSYSYPNGTLSLEAEVSMEDEARLIEVARRAALAAADARVRDLQAQTRAAYEAAFDTVYGWFDSFAQEFADVAQRRGLQEPCGGWEISLPFDLSDQYSLAERVQTTPLFVHADGTWTWMSGTSPAVNRSRVRELVVLNHSTEIRITKDEEAELKQIFGNTNRTIVFASVAYNQVHEAAVREAFVKALGHHLSQM